jgi:hypothetical protein
MNDPRIPAWCTLKFVEKMRDRAMDPTRLPDFGNKNFVVRIRDQAGSGHFGSSDNGENLKSAC